MTQDEAFKSWWYNEGSKAPYTHHDCEEHTMRMCEIAWKNAIYKEHEQSSKVGDYNRGWNDCLFASGIVKQSQRTWQGLTDEEIIKAFETSGHKVTIRPQDVFAVTSMELESQELKQVTVKDFIHMVEGKEDLIGRPVYFARWPNGNAHPPQRTWVGLTDEEIKEFDAWHDNREEEVGWCNPSEIVAYIEAKLKQKNGYAEEKNT
jgi:hypothetical protein